MNKKITKINTIVFLVMLIMSVFQPFFILNSSKTMFYNFLTTTATLLAAGVYMLVINFSKNPRLKRIVSLGIAFCYFYSFHDIYCQYSMDDYNTIFLCAKELIMAFVLFALYFLSLVINKSKDGIRIYDLSLVIFYALSIFVVVNIHIDRLFTTQLGFYLYFLSLILIIINSILLKSPPTPIEPSSKMIENPVDFADSYLFTNYLIGLPNDYEFVNNLSIIINREEKRELVIAINNVDMITLHIDYSRIKKIELRKAPIHIEKNSNKKDKTLERLAIINVIFKYLSPLAANDNLEKDITGYDEKEIDIVEFISITYEQKKEEKVIQLYTKSDSSLFMETLDKTLHFPIERI